MENAAPSDEERRTVHEKGFRIWQSLYLRAIKEPGFPQTCLQIQPALHHQLYFPDDLDLKLTYDYISVSGTSTWRGSSEHCNIPPLERHLQIPVSINYLTPLNVSADLDPSHQQWFNAEEDHLSVLIFAWSYILSARWAQLMPEAILAYTDSKACSSEQHGEQDPALAGVGVVNNDAARWWAAILAPGEGWEAYIAIGKDRFRSPWSITLPANSKFSLISHNNDCLLSDTAVSTATAFRFLSDYCALHDIVDQGYAALSAVLFLPLLRDSGKNIVLPRPIFLHELKRKVGASECKVQLDLSWVQEAHYLDKLLTLSCNTSGIRSLLFSVFYEPGIACNVVSPWLQSIFAVINSVEDKRILTHMLMNRVPHLAFFWLRGAILDIQKEVLQHGQFGLIPTELHAAVWSGTMQSFLQEPVHPAANNSIQRSDECRILYLTQEEHHPRWPILPWRPFGATALKDTEIDVRLHANCTGQGLLYAGWKWMCRNGRVVHQSFEAALAPTLPLAEPELPNVTISYEALDHGEESASQNATRSIFGWLRVDGYPPDEKRIHE
ncbi:uncharacterized protein BO80DRAFT_410522 [Aspergillus ibericus CBS 121593]|uniref:Uncharacterized protein n=1 Tax=Aspergillus ibericus CBS 121593 TaxID=1448316 RepID=A0A395GV86_9EURO|nr:hypothetical protein BO80DRAFT_410522 [Aspergillus ibericus CBS 121593]RAK99302.1 hypothetical protein BO80DRAFT_410522 [Aspergillus ibericus CBS 121593]